jgi:hypothetical protein
MGIKRGLDLDADRDVEQRIARSAAGMIRIYGVNAQAEAHLQAARWAKRNDAEGETTWRAIAHAIDKQQSQTTSESLVSGSRADGQLTVATGRP